ncbi:iron-containing alcohol dehydrogenase [Candidatus Williamhamiltonella defendens]|uniref:iron-containing alcohol dehydrogenase n=1 Tax=Candidatus Williamhamiltonella defendens TaxID=138072 RepID=UPI00387E522A
MAGLAFNEQTSVVVGAGGGKTLDTAKAVANKLKLSVAIVPIVASSDVPCNTFLVIDTDEGVFDSYRVYGKHS